MKPISFLAALVPALALLVFITALRNHFAWYNAAALFYGALALAEMLYLGVAFFPIELRRPALQERSAKIGAAE